MKLQRYQSSAAVRIEILTLFDIALRQILDKIFDTLPSEETVRTLKLTN